MAENIIEVIDIVFSAARGGAVGVVRELPRWQSNGSAFCLHIIWLSIVSLTSAAHAKEWHVLKPDKALYGNLLQTCMIASALHRP